MVPVELLPSVATDEVCEIAARTQTNQMCVVRWRADRDGFCRSALEIAKIVGDLLQMVGAELVSVFDLIEQDDIMGWFCLPRVSRYSRSVKGNLLCPVKLHGRPYRNPSLFAS